VEVHRLSCELEGREKALPEFIEAREQGTAAAAAAANRERPEFLWNKVTLLRKSIVERQTWLATYRKENIEAFLTRAKREWMMLDGKGRPIGVSLEKLRGLQEEVKEGMPKCDWVSLNKKERKEERAAMVEVPTRVPAVAAASQEKEMEEEEATTKKKKEKKKAKKTMGSTKMPSPMTPTAKMASHALLDEKQEQLTEEEEDDLLLKLADLELSEGEAGEREGECKEGGGERGGGGNALAAGMRGGAEENKKRGVRTGKWTLL
jgi:hypothetical protein